MKANVVATEDISNLIEGSGAVITQRLYSISGSQLSQLLSAWKKAGIKEVVEWIKEHGELEASYTEDFHITHSGLELPNNLWRAKLREWGLNDNNNRQ